jgi:hypothetical protein
MVKSFLGLSTLALFLAALPANAQIKEKYSCSEADIAKIEGINTKMAEGTKKASAMKSMAMAREMMVKGDIALCNFHINDAEKMHDPAK